MMETTFWGLLTLVFGGGLTGLPVGLPPAEPDPVMSQVAPDDALVYIAWNGTTEADGDSENNTERMLADPKIKRLIAQVIEAIEKGVKKGAGTGNNARRVAKEVPKVVQTIFTRPATFFVGQVGIGPKGVNAPLGLVINVGDKAEEFEKSFKVIQDLIADESGQTEIEGDTTWHLWPTIPGLPPISWGISKEYFVLSVGDGTRERILARMQGDKPSAFLARIAKRLPVERVAGITYINVENILKTVKPFMSGRVPDLDNLLSRLGVNEFKSISSVTGLDKTHTVSRTWIEIPKRSGIFDIIRSEPLTAADLAPIPADATIAMAIRLDVAATIDRIVDLVAQFEPRARDEFEGELAQAEDMMGFHAIDDLAKSVGDRWCIFQSPSQGGPLFTGWTAVASVKDAKKLKDIAAKMERFVALMNARMQGVQGRGQRFRREVGIKTTVFEDHTIYFVNSVGEELPVAPAWCVTDKEIILSMFPQGVIEYLEQRDTPRLADQAQIKARLAEKPFSISYYDSKKIFDSVYPMALIGANFLFSEMQRSDIDVNISMLPTASTIAKHLQPASSSIRLVDDGIEMYSNRTLPIGFASVQTLILPVAWFGMNSRSMSGPPILGALSPRRSRETAAKNKLKQIGLAMHNYHETFSKFPDGGLDKNGKTNGLSWRVHILPFIEQRVLYQEFNLDESWDSEHNKKLISRMPASYKTPGSKAKPGTTNYVVLRSDDSVITGKRGSRLADILDGTSNTFLVVEADDKSAVTWTKPSDIDFDVKKPHLGLGTLRGGKFLVGFADGSVRELSMAIDANTLRNLVNRRDGNVVNLQNIGTDTVRGPDAEAAGGPDEAAPDEADSDEGAAAPEGDRAEAVEDRAVPKQLLKPIRKPSKPKRQQVREATSQDAVAP